jgi:hypothetical protein
MSQEITNKTRCLLTREGIEIWITPEQEQKIFRITQDGKNRLIEIEGENLMTNSISGIYSAEAIKNLRRKKQGWWQCEDCGRWHQKGEQCGCAGGRY